MMRQWCSKGSRAQVRRSRKQGTQRSWRADSGARGYQRTHNDASCSSDPIHEQIHGRGYAAVVPSAHPARFGYMALDAVRVGSAVRSRCGCINTRFRIAWQAACNASTTQASNRWMKVKCCAESVSVEVNSDKECTVRSLYKDCTHTLIHQSMRMHISAQIFQNTWNKLSNVEMKSSPAPNFDIKPRDQAWNAR